MLTASFPTGLWQANCHVISGDGHRCVIVDPGLGALTTLVALTAERGWVVDGVLLTHGHIDHIAAVPEVARHFGVPVWIHEADRELLTDIGPLPAEMRAFVAALGVALVEPDDLRLLSGGETVEVGGAAFEVVHAPGHRPGCVLYRAPVTQAGREFPGATEIVLTGDVLFAGSIGRTDLPGGDADAMRATLARVVLPLPDTAVVLPGHGAGTTIARERATNPYLQPTWLRTA